MEGARVLLAGTVLGFASALPQMYLFELALKKVRPVSVAMGFACALVSFAMLTVGVFAVWLVAPQDVLSFGVVEAASYLLVWTVEAWRAWRDAQHHEPPGERKRGEPTR